MKYHSPEELEKLGDLNFTGLTEVKQIGFSRKLLPLIEGHGSPILVELPELGDVTLIRPAQEVLKGRVNMIKGRQVVEDEYRDLTLVMSKRSPFGVLLDSIKRTDGFLPTKVYQVGEPRETA